MKILLTLSLLLAGGLVYGQDDGRQIRIPVVFHVFYTGPVPDTTQFHDTRANGNRSYYLTRTMLNNEVGDLDADMQKHNADIATVIPEYRGVTGNPNIHFFIRQVIYVPVSRWKNNPDDADNTGFLHQQSPVVDPAHCLNVYTGNIYYNGQQTAGVSPVRINAAAVQTDDAVNISWQWTGWHYRLLTHETGHWLGLWHTWDRSQLSRTQITDIPLQHRYTDMDCDHCAGERGYPDRLIRTRGFTHSNYNNFMDYSGCRVMFSRQQAAVIRDVLRRFRATIWTSSPS